MLDRLLYLISFLAAAPLPFTRKTNCDARTAHSGYKNQDMTRLGMGLGLVLYGMVHRRRVRRLIYATSIDLDEGMSIRVMRGRRPIAEITPIP